MTTAIIPFIPIYKRKPNTFVQYKEVDKGDYVERIAEYKNKNGELCEMTAQIMWKELLNSSYVSGEK